MPHSDTIYVLINKQSGTALDLVLADLKTVGGYPRNGLDNQRVRSAVTPQSPLPNLDHDVVEVHQAQRLLVYPERLD